MKQIVIFLAIFLGSIINLQAQKQFEPRNYRWNIEPGLCYTFAVGSVNDVSKIESSISPSLEIRYKFNNNMEAGLYGSFCECDRTYGFWLDDKSIAIGGFKQQLWDIMAVANYNYRTSRFVELFGGAGLGISHNSHSTENIKELKEESVNSVIFMPRIGVKFRNHIKASLGYKFQGKNDSYGFVAIGWTFGIGRIH